jgi:hypothetical protein
LKKKWLHTTVSGVPLRSLLLLAIICLLGYWPVSSNLFSLKNDAYIYFLPCRYFISEVVQSGHLPLWNPYFYMGFPLHGDMQGGVWNPVVWLFSLFGRYNMTMLQYETLLYIFLGGAGMYKLLTTFGISHRSKMVIAVCYMFCGYIIDTAQITVWTGSAAFIPFVLLYHYRLLQGQMMYVNAVKTAIALYMLFTAGYPSLFIMCGYILLFATLLTMYNRYRAKAGRAVQLQLLKANVLAVIGFVLLALPALLSYWDYLPYYHRAGGVSLAQAQSNPFNPFAVVSYFFPLSVTKQHSWLTTDPTARSGFIGLFSIMLLLFIAKRKLTGTQKFVLTATVILFLFSLGSATPVRKIFYHLVPLMQYFRHPGTMRLFTSIGLLILSAFAIDDFFAALQQRQQKFYRYTAVITAMAVLVAILVHSGTNQLFEKLLLFKNNFSLAADKRSFIKQLYDSLSFADAILLEGVIQLLFLLLFIIWLSNAKSLAPKRFAILFAANVVLLAQLSVPATFVTQKSPAAINTLIRESPKGWPLPEADIAVAQNNLIEAATNREYGCASFYTKKIVQVEVELNPSFTKSLSDFDSDTLLATMVMRNPVFYLADTIVPYSGKNDSVLNARKVLFTDKVQQQILPAAGYITVKQFAPWRLLFEANADKPVPFVLFQNYNHNWKLYVDGEPAVIKKGNISFMYTWIQPGSHILRFEYSPAYVIPGLVISLVALLTLLFFICWNTYKSYP